MVRFLFFSFMSLRFNLILLKINQGGVANWYFVLARTSSDPKTPAGKVFELACIF